MLRPGGARQLARDRRGHPTLSEESEARRSRIEEKLRERLEATHVTVDDESHLHAGHPGARSGAGHFAAEIESSHFRGLSRVAAQRLVYDALADEMPHAIHALRIKTRVPDA